MATWVLAMVGLVLLATVGTLVTVILGGVPEDDQAGVPITVLVVTVLAFVFWNYREIRIRVTGQSFEARYGVLNKTIIPLSEIESVKPTQARFGRYFGIGVRFGTDGSRAYTTSFGPAVEIRSRSRRPFVVSTEHASELSQVLNSAVAGSRS